MASPGLLVLLWQVTGKLSGRPGRYSRAARFFSRYCARIARFLARIARFARIQSQKQAISARFAVSSSTFRIARVELIFQAAVKL